MKRLRSISIRLLCAAGLALLPLCAGSFAKPPQAPKFQMLDARYDTAWLPITEAEVAKAAASAGDSPVTMIQLMRRAIIADKQDALYRVLKTLAQKELQSGQIKHPVFISAYVAMIARTTSSSDEEGSKKFQWIEQSLKVSKHRWFALYVKADLDLWSEPASGVKRSIKTLEEAVRLAPQVPFIHSQLSWAYSALTMNDKANAPALRQKSLQQELTASRLKPINTQTYLGLIDYYKWRRPDAAKELFYRRKVESIIPPGTSLSPAMKAFLSRFDVTVPAAKKRA